MQAKLPGSQVTGRDRGSRSLLVNDAVIKLHAFLSCVLREQRPIDRLSAPSGYADRHRRRCIDRRIAHQLGLLTCRTETTHARVKRRLQ